MIAVTNSLQIHGSNFRITRYGVMCAVHQYVLYCMSTIRLQMIEMGFHTQFIGKIQKQTNKSTRGILYKNHSINHGSDNITNINTQYTLWQYNIIVKLFGYN